MKGFSGHLWNFILIFTDGASYACSSNHIDKFSKLQITKILKSSGWGLEKSELPWEQDFYGRRWVSRRTISLPSFNGLCHKLAKMRCS